MVAAVLQNMAPLTMCVPPNSSRTALSTVLDDQMVKTAARRDRTTGEAALEALLEGLMRDWGSDGMCGAVPQVLHVLVPPLIWLELGWASGTGVAQNSGGISTGEKDLIVQVGRKYRQYGSFYPTTDTFNHYL